MKTFFWKEYLFFLIKNILEITLGEVNGTPLQYSCLENPMDGGAWWAAVHGVAKSQTQLSDFIFTFHFHALEKAMATHSSVLAWRIAGMGSLVGCRLWGSHRVGHDWSDIAAAAEITLGKFCFFFIYRSIIVLFRNQQYSIISHIFYFRLTKK